MLFLLLKLIRHVIITYKHCHTSLFITLIENIDLQ